MNNLKQPLLSPSPPSKAKLNLYRGSFVSPLRARVKQGISLDNKKYICQEDPIKELLNIQGMYEQGKKKKQIYFFYNDHTVIPKSCYKANRDGTPKWLDVDYLVMTLISSQQCLLEEVAAMRKELHELKR